MIDVPWGSKPRILFTSIVLLSMITTIFLAACAPAAATGPRDDCGLIEPTDQDVSKILSFGADEFAPEKWVRSYTVEPYKITLTRKNDADLAVAYTEYLIYTCGYGQKELDDYFSEAGFNIVFEGYESHAQAAFCEIPNELALYRFDLVDEGIEYTAHYWVEQTDDTHVLVEMLVFPRTSAGQLELYGKKLFPKLTTCQS